jgi:hypothetical protein
VPDPPAKQDDEVVRPVRAYLGPLHRQVEAGALEILAGS